MVICLKFEKIEILNHFSHKTNRKKRSFFKFYQYVSFKIWLEIDFNEKVKTSGFIAADEQIIRLSR